MATEPRAEPPQAGSSGAAAAGGSAPQQAPPAASQSSTGGGAGAWNNNARITGLWSINEDKNSWVYVTNVGWVKLANNSESAIIALTILSAHAKQMASTVNYNTDDGTGQLTQMYVW